MKERARLSVSHLWISSGQPHLAMRTLLRGRFRWSRALNDARNKSRPAWNSIVSEHRSRHQTFSSNFLQKSCRRMIHNNSSRVGVLIYLCPVSKTGKVRMDLSSAGQESRGKCNPEAKDTFPQAKEKTRASKRCKDFAPCRVPAPPADSSLSRRRLNRLQNSSRPRAPERCEHLIFSWVSPGSNASP